MATKKYEFVEGDEKVILPGIVVKRIRALVAISATAFSPAVAPGDIGGYIQAVENLDAWVSDNAWVYGDARVYGDAQVSGNARVYGNARVSDNARVSGDARVYGDGLIFWASKVGTENGTLTVYNAKDNTLLVTRDCFMGTPEQFLAAFAEKHDERTQHEYELLIEVATSRIEAARNSNAI